VIGRKGEVAVDRVRAPDSRAVPPTTRARWGTAADLMLLTTVVIWALNFTVSKYILTHGLAPLPYSAVRYATASAVFAAITLGVERTIGVRARDLPLLGACVLLLFANQVGFVYSLDFTSATTVALIFGTLPIFTILISTLVGVERLTARFAVAAVVSFAGVALVAIGSGGGLSADLKGDLLALLGAATWGAYSVAIAPLVQRYSPLRISAVVLPATSVLLALAAAPSLASQDWPGSRLVWAGFAFAVLGPLVLTNLLWFGAIDRVGPSRASLFANLTYLLAAVFAVVLLSESLSAIQVAGGLGIALGILLAPRRDRQPPAGE
jgi:drug/metabolite transporter (DMT)-like permease